MIPNDSPYRNNSVSFSRTPSRGYPPFGALCEPVVSIDAVALDDYDEEHPKGSSLNDITSVFLLECWTYIQSGYQIAYCPYFTDYLRLDLSNFPEEPIKLVDASQEFLLIRAPATTDSHKVQLTYRFEGGSEVTRIFENREYPRDNSTEQWSLPPILL
ncbi:hypothetical protein [Porphyromonas loveana]